MIEVSTTAINEARKTLENIPNGIERATTSAINKTARGVRTDVVTEIRQDYAIKAKDIRNTLTLTKASKRSLSAVVKSVGSPISLAKFNIRPGRIQRKGSNNKPIRVQVKKGGGGPLRGAFLAQFSSGHMAVVERKGRARYPIRELYGPPVPKMLKNKGVLDKLNVKAKARMDKNFSHEIARIWKGYGT